MFITRGKDGSARGRDCKRSFNGRCSDCVGRGCEHSYAAGTFLRRLRGDIKEKVWLEKLVTNSLTKGQNVER